MILSIIASVVLFIVSFIGGTVLGSVILLNHMKSEVEAKIQNMADAKLERKVEMANQLKSCNEFMLSLPHKDQRAMKIIQSNQRILQEFQEEYNDDLA